MNCLDEQEKRIAFITTQAEGLEKSARFDPKQKRELACKCKELGDTCINFCRDTYTVTAEVRDDMAARSFKSHGQALNNFHEILDAVERVNTLFAFGNAYKERCLPVLDSDVAQTYLTMAGEKFEQSMVSYFSNKAKFSHEYSFAQLLQKNLQVRERVLRNRLLPRSLVIFHSLRSSMSRDCLGRIYYFADKYNCEIWEYDAGRVRAFDGDPVKYARERLDEASAVVFITSKEYDPESNHANSRYVIQSELDETIRIKKNGDPLAVFVIDLGNHKVVEKLRPYAIIAADDKMEEMFTAYHDAMKDIYSCRRYRCKK